MAEAVTILIDEDALDDLRTAALERCWDEQAQARSAAERKLKLTAQRHGERSKIYLAAVQAVDIARNRLGPIDNEIDKLVRGRRRSARAAIAKATEAPR